VSGLTLYSLEQRITGTLYAALYTSAPSYSAGGTEATFSGYARVAHAAWVTVETAPEFAEVRNNGAIEWPAAAEGVKDLVAWGLFDAEVGGNLLAWGLFVDGNGVPAPFSIDSGDQARIIDQDLRIRAR
jgi:hypothetical protein